MGKPLLALQELSKFYVNGQNVVAGLNKISLSFERGEFVAITGESGSGKSSLAHILGGILPYEDGELFFDGKPTSHFDSEDWENYRAESVGFISQSYGILPGASVFENVTSALRLTGMDQEQAADKARSILEEVELWPLRTRRAAKLSSGQKQRLSIARALAKPCAVLIADEPTGNLDPENSDKVIALLAKASRDRLVILITHEFSECENHVTRHISLQDGRICADARLRSFAPVESPMPKRGPVGKLSGYIAALQLRSRPAWSIVVLLFTVLTAFSVFAFLGSFIVALDDTSTRIYQSDAFLNGEKERIVAERTDEAPMTQEDYDTILSIAHVEKIEKYGYLRDITYAYREGTDYTINYIRTNCGSFRNPKYVETSAVQITAQDQFLQTVPLFSRKTEFLTAGRLPQQFNEVVATDESLLDTQLTVYISNQTEWDGGACIALTVTVTGITDHGSGLYFHDDVGRTLTLDYKGAEYTYLPSFDLVPSQAKYINYRDARSQVMYGTNSVPFYAEMEPATGSTLRLLLEDEVYVSMEGYRDVLTEEPQANYDRLYTKGLSTPEGTWHIAGLDNVSTLPTALWVSPDTFQRLMTESCIGNGEQISITVSDYAYAQRVLDKLEKAGYYALSPYVLGSAQIDRDLAAQRQQTLFICLGALAFILVLQLIVLRAMFHMQTESYKTLRDMGLTCQTAQNSLLLQILIFTAAGQLLGLGLIGVLSASGVAQIANVTKYLYGFWWVGICLVHLLSTLLAAWLIAAGLKKQVYPRRSGRRDLNIDEEEAEV